MQAEYLVTLNGITPLIVHRYNIAWADEMEQWRKDPENKKRSKAGDDRTPAWRWLGCLHHDDEYISIPAEMLMKALLKAGAQMSTGQGKKTFKAQSQFGIIPVDAFFHLRTEVGKILLSDVWKLREEEDFAVHCKRVREFGFELYVRPVPVGQSTHIRVRPKFNNWSCDVQLAVTDDTIKPEILKTMLGIAGSQCGFGEWRPTSPRSPGPFGRFEVQVDEM